MARSKLGDYIHDALISAKKHLDEGDLKGAEKDRLNLKSQLEQLFGEPRTPTMNFYLRALDWGAWKELKDLQNYEHVHDSNRPYGDSREFWVVGKPGENPYK